MTWANVLFTMTIEIKASFNFGVTANFVAVNLILHSHELQTFETSIKMATQERVFGLKNCKYTVEEKKALAAKVKECKQQYDDEVKAMKGKTHWDTKRKRHVPDT